MAGADDDAVSVVFLEKDSRRIDEMVETIYDAMGGFVSSFWPSS